MYNLGIVSELLNNKVLLVLLNVISYIWIFLSVINVENGILFVKILLILNI